MSEYQIKFIQIPPVYSNQIPIIRFSFLENIMFYG